LWSRMSRVSKRLVTPRRILSAIKIPVIVMNFRQFGG
jgi:hypothetical protein